ncbi:MAG: hypothetical protein PVH61_25705 [Candidatus Aminicenantes bacterium]
MALLDQLPDALQFQNILGSILGSESGETGINGVLTLLRNMDAENIASAIVSQLDNSLSSGISTDSSAITAGVLDQFNQAADSLPSGPGELVAPISDLLGDISNLSTGELANNLLESSAGFQQIQTLVSGDPQALFSDAAQGFTQLKAQFISGGFGELRQWSSNVQGLYNEIVPLLNGDHEAVIQRLITYLTDKITALVEEILPPARETLSGLVTRLEQAISAHRVNQVQTMKTELAEHFNRASQEFRQGNVSNITHLNAAEAGFQQLTAELSDITSGISQALNSPVATAEGMMQRLQSLYERFESIEVVDLDNIRDKFTEAIQQAQEGLENVNLEVVRESIQGAFAQVNRLMDEFDMSRWTEALSDLQERIQEVLDRLDPILLEVVASIRNIFTRVRETLRSIARALGSENDSGEFQFHIVQDIRGFLETIKTLLQENVQSQLQQFKQTVDQALEQVQEVLTTVQGEIESVKDQLLNALQGVNEQLQNLDVTAKLEDIRQKLDDMLSQLGHIDFDPVIDPVVNQINEISDQLRQIDVSSLNDLLVTALQTAVSVLRQVDFTGEIVDVLLEEMDKILEMPKNGLQTIEDRVESALAKLTSFDPGVILKPLDDVFEPVTNMLDALQLDALLEPLDQWHARVQEQVNNVSPAALLQPVIDLYNQLQQTLDSVAPGALIQFLQDAINDLKTQLGRLGISGMAGELSAAADQVKNFMDQISPESLFNPLVDAFDKITAALDRFTPSELLAPAANLFERLMDPLDHLNENHVGLIHGAFTGLKELTTAFNPQHNLQAAARKYNEILNRLQQINLGGILSDLRGPYEAMKTAFAPHRSDHADIAGRVDAMNPMRSDIITRAASQFQDFQRRLQEGFSGVQVPGELENRFRRIQPRLESLIPDWVRDNMTPASIKEAFQQINPLDIGEEVNQLYNTFKEQVQGVNPRILQENLRETVEHLRDTVGAINPQEIIAQIEEVMNHLGDKLDLIDLAVIREELDALVEEISQVIGGLDPRPIIGQLEALTREVRDMVNQLKPSEILSELDAPFQTVKDLVGEFDPQFLKEPLLGIFADINAVISQIDIGIILQPFQDRLQGLRDELEQGLRRTETAFNGMLAAIPV